jgi:hypothetical protein
MDFRGFSKMYRYSRDVIVTEKIDGTNAQICITGDGQFFTGSRSRWITPQDDNHGFSRWAHEHKDELMMLGVGQHFGEWWGSGIQRGYGLEKGDKRFSLFNVSRWGDEPLFDKPVEERPPCCDVVPTLWVGRMEDLNVKEIMSNLLISGSKASEGFKNPEGIVIFHTAGNFCLKKTFEKDEQGKWAI